MLSLRQFLFCLFFCVSFSAAVHAQTASEKELSNAVEKLRDAMIKGDSVALLPLLSPQLSYGHSNGLIENRGEFLHKIGTGISDFITMNLSDQTITVSGQTAIVRHTVEGDVNDNGKAGTLHLKVLLVWEKYKRGWRLLARQAVKII